MNFLAHCAIADRAAHRVHPDVIAGGFLGDFVKGRVPESLPAALATGVRLHRRIDAYSNGHTGIRRSCQRFPRPLRRFAPVFVDVVADHLLARHWPRFHPQPLTAFTARAYAAIRPHADRLPEDGRRFFEFMHEHDLLARYREREAMERGLASVVRRLRRPDLTHDVCTAVDDCLPGLEQDFLGYFPDMLSHAAGWLLRQE
jgi:acyl carrier protein phosphodiesterase